MIKHFRSSHTTVFSINIQRFWAPVLLKHSTDRISATANARRWLFRLLALPLLLTAATGYAAAVDVNFDGSLSPLMQGCTLPLLSKTYICVLAPRFNDIIITAGYTVIGDLQGSTAILKEKAKIIGNLNVSTTLSMDPYSSITGNATVGTTLTSKHHASVGGYVKAVGTVTMDASSTVGGYVEGTTITLAESGHFSGDVRGTTVSLAASGCIRGDVNGTTVDLAANADIAGNVNGTTVNLAERASIGGSVVAATTVKLEANASVGGNINASDTFGTAPTSMVGGIVKKAGAILPTSTMQSYTKKDTGCTPIPSTAPTLADPASVKSREWRQLFMR